MSRATVDYGDTLRRVLGLVEMALARGRGLRGRVREAQVLLSTALDLLQDALDRGAE